MSDDVRRVTPDLLKSFVDRIETLEEEKGAVAEQIKSVYSEAKSEGFSVAILREIIKLRRLRPYERAERDEMLRVYMDAIEAAAAGGNR